MAKTKLVIGVAGEICSGKTTFAHYLEETYGFFYIRYSQVLSEMMSNEKIVINRRNLQRFGEHIFQTIGGMGLSKILVNKSIDKERVVIDGLRHKDDYKYLKEYYKKIFYLAYMDSTISNRQERFWEKEHENSYNSYLKHPVEKEISSLKKYSDFTLVNNSDKTSLTNKIENFVTSLITPTYK